MLSFLPEMFGCPEMLPSELQRVVLLQRTLADFKIDNLENTYNQLIEQSKNFQNYDDLASNLCDFAQRNTRHNADYAELASRLCFLGTKFISSLFEAIRPCNGQFFRALYQKRIFSKNQVREKISVDRRMHYFFLPELNLKQMAVQTKGVSDYFFLKHFSKLLTFHPTEIKDVCDYGYHRKSMEFVIKYDENKLLKVLIKKHPDKIHQQLDPALYEVISEKCMPIDLAAYYGASKCFRLLRKAGEVVTRKTCTYSIYGGSKMIIRLCKEAGGDFSQALTAAIETHRQIYYKWLLEITPVDDLVAIPFDFIISTKNYPVIWSFFLSGFDSSHLQKGNTLLHLAVMNRQYTFVKLIANDSTMINKENAIGWTPLTISVGMGYFNVSKLLIENGANTDIKWNRTETLLSTAMQFSANDISQYLYEHGSLVPPSLVIAAKDNERLAFNLIKTGIPVNFRECKSNTPLHLAVLDDDILRLQTLLQNGTQMDTPNELGYTPFHVAAALCNETIAAMFISRNCNVNTSNIIGETPLMCTIRNGIYDISSIMIEMGADAYVSSRGGLTALHIACLSSRQDICALLIVNNAPKGSRDIDEKSPIDYASIAPIRILFM